jgi:hypothetical protein
LFEQLDRPALKPLPAQRYVIAEWKPVKPNIDYHVEVERHYYSVPYQPLHVHYGSDLIKRCGWPRMPAALSHKPPPHSISFPGIRTACKIHREVTYIERADT